MSQIHNKFKVFTGKPTADKTIGDLASQIEKFVSESKVAAKSIGVEYLEGAQRLIMTLGYADNQPSVPIKIDCVRIGKVDTGGDFSKLEKAMMEAAGRQKNIICHELYVTDDQEFFMVFMTQKG